jgi:hypothetical protein
MIRTAPSAGTVPGAASLPFDFFRRRSDETFFIDL